MKTAILTLALVAAVPTARADAFAQTDSGAIVYAVF